MTDDEPTRQERPVLSGVIALIGVTLVVGLILGGGALIATRLLGVTGGSAAADEGTASRTLLIPPHESSEPATGPYITLEPGDDPGGGGGSDLPAAPATPTKSADGELTLAAAETAVSPMEQIHLTGDYPGGGNSILQVQQFQGSGWADFPVTIPVSGDSFATYIQASAAGLNRFRVVDTDTGDASNEIKVQIG